MTKDTLKLGKFSLWLLGEGNMYYRRRWRLSYANKNIGILFTNSRSAGLIPEDNMQLQLFNNKLYEKYWLEECQEFFSTIHAHYRSMVRLDIALDGGSFFSIFEDWTAGKVVKVGRSKMFPQYTGQRNLEGFYIGSAKSKKRLICYDKTKDIEKKNKSYIYKFWDQCGLDHTKNIERLELRLNNEENRRVPDMMFQGLTDPSHLASLMKTHLNGFFEFRIVDQQHNITRKKNIEPINWLDIGGSLLPKNSTIPTTEIFSGKIACKKLWQIFFITKKQYYFDISFEMAFNMDHITWMNDSITIWQKEIENRLGQNPTGEIKENWLTLFREYDIGEQILVPLKEIPKTYKQILDKSKIS
jgi:hypothetical protein